MNLFLLKNHFLLIFLAKKQKTITFYKYSIFQFNCITHHFLYVTHQLITKVMFILSLVVWNFEPYFNIGKPWIKSFQIKVWIQVLGKISDNLRFFGTNESRLLNHVDNYYWQYHSRVILLHEFLYKVHFQYFHFYLSLVNFSSSTFIEGLSATASCWSMIYSN